MSRAEAAPKARLEGAFAAGRAEGRALLMPFVMCGYPSRLAFVEIAAAAAEAGADVLEVGIPFSDPIMDGPVIQGAATRVLRQGLPTGDALALVGDAARRTELPLVVMTYYNLVFRAGIEEFARACAEAGAAGAIVPDLSVEEAGPWLEACHGAGIAPVFIAAPTSTPDRLAAIAKTSEGFIYAASTLGVTGVREDLSSRARDLVTAIRATTETPVAVGIGVSTAEQAHEVAAYADGVIVGSALVKKIGAAKDPVRAAGKLVADLRVAVAR